MRSVRAQGGFVAARLLLALVASTGVTASVAGPMAYQARQAEVRAEQREQQRPQPTVTTEPAPDPDVLGATTVPLPGETSTVVPPTTAVPRSSTQPGGGVTTVGDHNLLLAGAHVAHARSIALDSSPCHK